MTKKVFSTENGSISIANGCVYLIDNDNVVATTNKPILDIIYHLPSTLIRTPKSDKELAVDRYGNDIHLFAAQRDGFVEGRKSYGDKEFHLSREELNKLLDKARDSELRNVYDGSSENNASIVQSITPPIYPTRIEVDYDDENYYWENLKAYYE